MQLIPSANPCIIFDYSITRHDKLLFFLIFLTTVSIISKSHDLKSSSKRCQPSDPAKKPTNSSCTYVLLLLFSIVQDIVQDMDHGTIF